MNESVKSRYRPKNPAKYKGNPNNIICRSNWEKKLCQWCDTNESILLWASEEFSIPYVSPLDRRVHQYYPDFLIKVQEGGGAIRDYVIEVKPKRQCIPPKRKSKVTKSYGTPTGTHKNVEIGIPGGEPPYSPGFTPATSPESLNNFLSTL